LWEEVGGHGGLDEGRELGGGPLSLDDERPVEVVAEERIDQVAGRRVVAFVGREGS
jgi:hypothetical protein